MNMDDVDTLPMDVDMEFWQDSEPRREFDMEIGIEDPEPEEAVPASSNANLLPEDPILAGGGMASSEVSAGAKSETTPDAVATDLTPPGHPEKRKSEV